MSQHKPEKKAEKIVSPATKSKPGTGKVAKGELARGARQGVGRLRLRRAPQRLDS